MESWHWFVSYHVYNHVQLFYLFCIRNAIISVKPYSTEAVYACLFFKLEDNCFTTLYRFLLFNSVSQPYRYMYFLPSEPPAFPSSHPTRSSQSTELGPLWVQQFSSRCRAHTCAVYTSVLLSQLGPSFPRRAHGSLLYVCISVPALHVGSSVPFF